MNIKMSEKMKESLRTEMEKLKWLKTRYGYRAEDDSGKIHAMVFEEEGGYSTCTDKQVLDLYPDANAARAAAEEALSLPQQLELFATE